LQYQAPAEVDETTLSFYRTRCLAGGKGKGYIPLSAGITNITFPRRERLFLPIAVSRWAKKEEPSAFSVPQRWRIIRKDKRKKQILEKTIKTLTKAIGEMKVKIRSTL